MSQIDKLRDRFLQKPTRSDLQKGDVVRLLSHYGYHVERDNGTHIIFSPDDDSSGKPDIEIAAESGRHVKPHYIREIVKALHL